MWVLTIGFPFPGPFTTSICFDSLLATAESHDPYQGVLAKCHTPCLEALEWGILFAQSALRNKFL